MGSPSICSDVLMGDYASIIRNTVPRPALATTHHSYATSVLSAVFTRVGVAHGISVGNRIVSTREKQEEEIQKG